MKEQVKGGFFWDVKAQIMVANSPIKSGPVSPHTELGP